MRMIKTNTIEVKIYSSKASMRRAIRKIGYECTHTESMVIPVTIYSYKNGKEVLLQISAEMYVHKNITLPVLVHETLHAATSALRFKGENLDLGNKIQFREEYLAYMQTAILQDILKTFFPKRNSAYQFTNIKRMALD